LPFNSANQAVQVLTILLFFITTHRYLRVIFKEKGKLVAFFSTDIDDNTSTSAPAEHMELQERLSSELRKYCVSYLTSTMIPSRFRLVWPAFPVTENGKVTLLPLPLLLLFSHKLPSVGCGVPATFSKAQTTRHNILYRPKT